MTAPTFPIYLDKEIESITATAGTWTLTLSNVDGIIQGMRFNTGGLQDPTWNREAELVDSVNLTLKTVTYTHSNTTLAPTDVWGQFHLVCDWISLTDLETFLGYSFAGADITFAQAQVDASNDWAFRTRRSAGYQDHPNVAPGGDVQQGTLLYASQLVKQRGAIDGFASFEQQGFGTVPGQSYGTILQLLGCKRPQVG
jgi:hypothetical protein